MKELDPRTTRADAADGFTTSWLLLPLDILDLPPSVSPIIDPLPFPDGWDILLLCILVTGFTRLPGRCTSGLLLDNKSPLLPFALRLLLLLPSGRCCLHLRTSSWGPALLLL